jgi:S1-C subfamily serine protease
MKRLSLSSRLRTPLTAATGAVVALVLMLVYLELNPQDGRFNESDIRTLADEQIEAIPPELPVEPEIFNLVRPSVVTIYRDPSSQSEVRGVGSGVIVDEFGNILTAYHVIEGLTEVRVRFHDGQERTASVDREEPERDLAVLHVGDLPESSFPATLAGSVRPGDQVMAIGAPFGLEGTLTLGVVSGLNRSFVVEETGQVLTGMIQFDAAVNPGNSGGPLVDMSGRVVGIVSGIINPTNDGVFIGLGFATPIESASGIFPPLG